ncbi:hypothetical protein H8B15_19840 [Hymenobacter sp. BT507]|uniref:Uncharacterized protein n=1 Tax=Hymenobacter citatus TaxID=2763506 RepID=A0ABR7MQJ2_9BACT|nr:hypothetical protein [Hymenobacter citatus]MBC6613184.1 hypothetical protein [Hymenobacter citatus]
MSQLLMTVLGDYNQQLSALLARAEQQWPALCAHENERLSEQKIEQRCRTLLLAMTYLDQLQQLLNHHPEWQEPTAFWQDNFPLPPGIRPAQ